jgi:hypothetical protein
MEYELIQDQTVTGAWRVEAINFDGDGEVYVTIFAGPEARQRAEQFMEWKSPN